MKCHPLRWLWGLPLVLMWFWIAFLSEKGPIKDDLQHRARAALDGAGHGWAVATFVGRDGVLMGRASSVEGRKAAEQLVRDIWGVRIVQNRAALVAQVEDYVWSAVTSRDGILLTGHVPNEKAHARILKFVSADFPNVAIDDQLKLARGAPNEKQWLAGIRFGLHQLQRLTFGRLELNGTQLSLSGEARSFSDYREVRNALSGQMPRGISLASDNVTPPIVSPYAWSAVRDGRQLVLSGHVPSEVTRESLFEHAKKYFPDFAIIDRMETAAGAQTGWRDVTGVLVQQLALLETGIAQLVDRELVLEGHAESEARADEIKASVEEVVSGAFKTVVNITYPEPLPPIISPFLTSIDVGKSRIRVFGYVPSEDVRGELIASIKKQFPSHEIVDDLVLGSGAPSTWYECLKAGLEGVEQLGVGQIRVLDQVLTVIGETDQEDVARKLPGRVRAVANRACETKIDVKLNLPPEPDLSWAITYDGAGIVSLEGEVPDGDTKDALLRVAREVFAEKRVVDRMSVVPAYGARWRQVALMGVRLLHRLRKGSAVLEGNELVIRGESADAAIAGAVKDQLEKNILSGYLGRAEIIVRSDAMIWAEDEARRRAEDAAAGTWSSNRSGNRNRYVDAEEEHLWERVESDPQEDDAARRRREAALSEARLRAERAEKERAAWAAERRRLAEELKRKRAQEEAERLAAFRLRRERQIVRRKKADKCQDALRSAASEGVIRFAFASHKLRRQSFPTLNNLVSIAKSCPQFVIEISGHTDSKGSEERNLVLSKKTRAIGGQLPCQSWCFEQSLGSCWIWRNPARGAKYDKGEHGKKSPHRICCA